MKRRTIAVLLALSLCLSAPIAAHAESGFADVPEDAWYAAELAELVEAGGISGYADGTFVPDGEVTVEEYIKILVGCTFEQEAIDEFEGETWSEKYILTAQSAGLLNGFDVGAEHLQCALTRNEAAWLLVDFARYGGEEPAVPEGIEKALRDYASLPESCREAVGKACGAGLMTGYEDRTFRGEGSLTRCEAAVTVVRLLDAERRVELTIPDYDYSSPVPESAAVDDSFFADAMFIGNSLCAGFGLYSGLTQGTFAGVTSMTVYSIWQSSYAASLQTQSYGKIYIMLGINEIGNGAAAVAERYGAVVEKLRQMQPDADIYVQALLPVCEEKLTSAQKSYHITNYYVSELNAALQEMCAEQEVYFVNLHEAFADETGALPSSLTWDGVHLNAAPYQDWLAYLKTHTV